MMKEADVALWRLVHDERQALIADLEPLASTSWLSASTCPGWNVHAVLAHRVDTAKTTRLSFMRDMLAARFDFDRANAVGVAREKAQDPQETLAEFRAVRLRTSSPPAPLATRLVEAFVHGEDIRGPLGIDRDYPAENVATALAYQLKTSVKMGGGKELAKGWHMMATDTVFSHGAGAEVRASAMALLLAVSGRPVAVTEFSGAGAETFAATL